MFPDAIPPQHEGRFAIVTDVECGMRWTRRCCSVIVARTNDIDAYGEVVWSWRPGAGAKWTTMLAHRVDDRGKTAGPWGEHEGHR